MPAARSGWPSALPVRCWKRAPAAAAAWSTWKTRFAALFARPPRAHCCALLEGSDVCSAPVLSIAEAAVHPHNVARGIYSVGADGAVQAVGAPRFLPLSMD